MEFIDPHSHILPGLDDGPGTTEEALEILSIYKDKGIKKIICTPHIFPELYDNSREDIMTVFKEFTENLPEEFKAFEFFPGAELMVYPELDKDLRNGELITMNDKGKHLLIELPLSLHPPFTEDLIFRIQVTGVMPILSHPERYTESIKNPKSIFKFIEHEVYIQLNAGSILGSFGSKIKDLANFLVEHRAFHLIATDTHGARSRFPNLPEVYDYLKDILEPDEMEIIFEKNPRALLEGGTIESLELKEPVDKKKKFFSFLKKIFL